MTQVINQPGQPAIPPLSLYIHFPWCLSKCPYCDFNSHEINDAIPQEKYFQALKNDLATWVADMYLRPIKSIFIGGGTPNLMEVENIDKLLNEIHMVLNVQADAEITIEANPSTVDVAKFNELANTRINRISLGVQSFNDEILTAIGRNHDSAQAKKAIAVAMDNFERVNIDLMYALPKQSKEKLINDLNTATSFNPQHISAYHLMLEPGTVFYKNPPRNLPDEDLAATLDDTVSAELSKLGYRRYEVSAYSLVNEECIHNLNYWMFGDYLAIGAGAHAKFTNQFGIYRSVRFKSPRQYMEAVSEKNAVSSLEKIKINELIFEFMLNALRLVNGFKEEMFFTRTNIPISRIAKNLEYAQSLGWIEWKNQVIKPTSKGIDFLKDLCMIFLPPTKENNL